MEALWPILPAALLAKIALSCLLSGLIGLEREYRQKTAGLRTHLLVGLGATIFTILSIEAFPGSITDQSRVAAQIVTGIGFIGAGAILRQGLTVRGLTTAATLWLVAAIGMAVGTGWYALAIAATLAALGALVLLVWVERLMPAESPELHVQLRYRGAESTQANIVDVLEEEGWRVRRGRARPESDGQVAHTLWLSRQGSEADWHRALRRLENMHAGEFSWELGESSG